MHTFQNIAHLLGPKTQLSHRWGRGGGEACMSLIESIFVVSNRDFPAGVKYLIPKEDLLHKFSSVQFSSSLSYLKSTF